MGTSVADLGIRIFLQDSASSGLGAFEGSLGRVGYQLGNLMSIWQNLSPLMQNVAVVAAGSGLAFGGFAEALKYSVDKAADVEDSMAQVQIAIAGADDHLQALQATIIDLADTSIYSTKEIADGFVLLGERGYSAVQILNGHMGQALRDFAEATNSDVVPATDLLSSTMQTFGARADEASHYADMLTSAFYNGTPNIDQLKQAINQAGAQAAAAGWRFSDLATALDLLAKDGLVGSQAGTALRFMLSSLLDPTNKVQQDLSALGLLTINQTAPAFHHLATELENSGIAGKTIASRFDGTLTTLRTMYTEAQKLGLLHTDQTFYEWAVQTGVLTDKLFDAHGHLKDLRGVIDTLGGALSKLKTPQDFDAFIGDLGGARSGKAFELLLKNLGATDQQISQLLPKITTTGTAQDEAAKRTNTWHAIIKELQTTFESLAGAIGTPLLTPLKNLATSINALLDDLMKNHPALLTAIAAFLAIGTAVAGVTFMVTSLIFVFTALGSIILPVLAVVTSIAVLATIGVLIAANWKTVQQVFGSVGKAFGDLGGKISSTVSGITASIGQLPGIIGNLFHSAGQRVVSGLSSWRYGIAAFFSSTLPTLIMGAIGNLGTMLYTSGRNMLSMFGSGIRSAFGFITGPINQVASTISNLLEHHSPAKEGPLSRSDQFMPNMMRLYASGILDHIPLVASAAHMAASAIGSAFVTHPHLAYTHASVVGPHPYPRPVNINLYIDSKQVETFVLKDLTRDLKLNGMGRYWR